MVPSLQVLPEQQISPTPPHLRHVLSVPQTIPVLHLEPAQHGFPAKPQVLQVPTLAVLAAKQTRSVPEHADALAAPVVGQQGSSCLPQPQRPAEHFP